MEHRHVNTRPDKAGPIALLAAVVERARADAEDDAEWHGARPVRRGGERRRPGGEECPVHTGRPHRARQCAIEWLSWLAAVADAARAPRWDVADEAAEEIALRILAQAA